MNVRINYNISDRTRPDLGRSVYGKLNIDQRVGFFLLKFHDVLDSDMALNLMYRGILNRHVRTSINYKLQDINLDGGLFKLEPVMDNVNTGNYIVYLGFPGALKYDSVSDALLYTCSSTDIENYFTVVSPLGHRSETAAIPEQAYITRINELENSVREISEKRDIAESMNKSCRETIDYKNDVIDGLIDESDNFNKQYLETKRDLEKLENEYRIYKLMHNRTIETESEKIESLLKINEGLIADKEELNGNIVKLNNQINDVQHDLEEEKQRYQALSDKMNATIQARVNYVEKQCETDIHDLQEQLNSAKTTNTNLNSKIHEKSQKILELENANQELENEYDELWNELLENAAVIDELLRKIDTLTDDSKKKVADDDLTDWGLGKIIATGAIAAAGAIGLFGVISYICIGFQRKRQAALAAAAAGTLINTVNNQIDAMLQSGGADERQPLLPSGTRKGPSVKEREIRIEQLKQVRGELEDFQKQSEMEQKRIDNLITDEYERLLNTASSGVQQPKQVKPAVDNIKKIQDCMMKEEKLAEIIFSTMTEKKINDLTSNMFISNSTLQKIRDITSQKFLNLEFDFGLRGQFYTLDLKKQKGFITNFIKNEISPALTVIQDSVDNYLQAHRDRNARDMVIRNINEQTQYLLNLQKKYEGDHDKYQEDIEKHRTELVQYSGTKKGIVIDLYDAEKNSLCPEIQDTYRLLQELENANEFLEKIKLLFGNEEISIIAYDQNTINKMDSDRKQLVIELNRIDAEIDRLEELLTKEEISLDRGVQRDAERAIDELMMTYKKAKDAREKAYLESKIKRWKEELAKSKEKERLVRQKEEKIINQLDQFIALREKRAGQLITINQQRDHIYKHCVALKDKVRSRKQEIEYIEKYITAIKHKLEQNKNVILVWLNNLYNEMKQSLTVAAIPASIMSPVDVKQFIQSIFGLDYDKNIQFVTMPYYNNMSRLLFLWEQFVNKKYVYIFKRILDLANKITSVQLNLNLSDYYLNIIKILIKKLNDIVNEIQNSQEPQQGQGA